MSPPSTLPPPLITCDQSFLKASTQSPTADKDNNRDDALIAGLEGVWECGTSSKIVFTFHLVGCLSIPLFICISSEVCAGSWRASPCVFVCSNCQSKEADSLLCQGLQGECSNSSQRGIVCEIQMLETAPLFAYCYHRSLAKRGTVLGSDLTREKQNDKLSHQLSSKTPPPLFPPPYTAAPPSAVDSIKKQQITK